MSLPSHIIVYLHISCMFYDSMMCLVYVLSSHLQKKTSKWVSSLSLMTTILTSFFLGIPLKQFQASRPLPLFSAALFTGAVSDHRQLFGPAYGWDPQLLAKCGHRFQLEPQKASHAEIRIYVFVQSIFFDTRHRRDG